MNEKMILVIEKLMANKKWDEAMHIFVLSDIDEKTMESIVNKADNFTLADWARLSFHVKEKNRLIEIEESDAYQDARDKAFNQAFLNFSKVIPTFVTEEDIQGFLDSFEFPNEHDWIAK